MDLTLDAEQRQIVKVARQYLDRTFHVADQAELTNADTSSRDALVSMGELGWTALTIPEELGGAGGGLIALCLVLEELGRAGVTSPIVSSVALAGGLLVADGGRQTERLSAIAEGGMIATVALLEPDASSPWAPRAVTAPRDGDGWSLTAEYTLVAYAHEADLVLFDVDLEGRGRSVVAIDLPRDGVEVRRQRVLGGEPRAAVSLRDVVVRPGDVLELSADAAAGAVERAVDVASVLHAAHTVGACEGALQLSVTWANDREQFGRKIGSFQSVSNRCADMRLAIDAARLLTWEAAWSIESGSAREAADTSVAASYLDETGEVVIANSHQVHGALGYSTEYPLHVYTRLIKAYQASWGAAPVHVDRVASVLGL